MGITAFHHQVYWSFVGTFCLLGFAAVIFLRTSLKQPRPKLARFQRMAGRMCWCLGFHGFVTTYLYVGYLNGSGALLPLALTLLPWVIAAPYLVLQLCHLNPQISLDRKRIWALGFGASQLLGVFSLHQGDAGASFILGGLSFGLAVGVAVWAWPAFSFLSSKGGFPLSVVVIYGLCLFPLVCLLGRPAGGDIMAQFLLNLLICSYIVGVLLSCRRLQ